MNNSSAVLYAVAATVWLVLAFATWNIMYIVLSATFYVLAIRKWKRRKE